MDVLCDLFEPMIGARKRGPAERADKLAFLKEINEADLKTYSPEQLSTILSQRSQVHFPPSIPSHIN